MGLFTKINALQKNQTNYDIESVMKPLVSVIIPTYNRAQTIERAVNSVLGQTMGNLELIVVDDGSTDETQEILKKFQYIRVISTENQGVSRARNLGVQAAKGSWVAFLDSDDEWLPEKLAKQFHEASLKPECQLVHGDEIWIRNGVRVNPMKKHAKSGGDIFENALKLCCISPSTAMIKKSLFEELGGFREDFPVCEDYDLWLKVTARHPVAYVDDFLIKKYGGHEDQLSRRYKAMDYWRVVSMLDLLENSPLSEKKWEMLFKEVQKKSDILLKGYRKHQNLSQYDFIFSRMKRLTTLDEVKVRQKFIYAITSSQVH